MDLNVIFALSALGAFVLLLPFGKSYRIPLIAALLVLATSAVLIFIGRTELGDGFALATFYLFSLGVLLLVTDHLVDLRRKADSAAPPGPEKE